MNRKYECTCATHVLLYPCIQVQSPHRQEVDAELHPPTAYNNESNTEYCAPANLMLTTLRLMVRDYAIKHRETQTKPAFAYYRFVNFELNFDVSLRYRELQPQYRIR